MIMRLTASQSLKVLRNEESSGLVTSVDVRRVRISFHFPVHLTDISYL